ncbi:DNA double-strand break repair nuclease NurA [Aquifex aeolicus]|uniref:NurA domain-containing protein n=1 Tax=Aquifex aeolicus (strain VF5) TaxID=224324 RepID=O67105_AQUAE|nr:DNA double-strand break repair nuclease NurA [Aquifex aeolicus]AAC07067.1 putative protein [Aquifex aeolicus VF5]
MPLWGRFRISFDSWKMMSLDNHVLEESSEIGEVNVETSEWKPINGCIPEDYDEENLKIAFIDGVRRTENIVYLEDPNSASVVEGAFVSIGAGAMVLSYGKVNSLEDSLKKSVVKRYFLLRDNVDISQPTIVFLTQTGKLEFKVDRAKKELSPYVNELMANLELWVAQQVYKAKMADLMITDGTLHYVAKAKNLPFIGYVKKHRKIYLYPEHIKVLQELKVGQRTPIILIHSQPTMDSQNKSFDKYTWYVKLNENEGITSVARLEVPAELGLEEAVKLANLTAYLMPKFASAEFNDKRAPQNLIPIKYLENYLRRRLGSQSLIRRLIAQRIMERV